VTSITALAVSGGVSSVSAEGSEMTVEKLAKLSR
jgi:hypothetical protein